MENTSLYDTDCSIYPGDYVPLLKPDEIEEELRHSHEGEMCLPPVNITELSDSFKVDIAIPGVKRQDFMVHANENVLFVRVLHKEYRPQEVERFQLHEFNYECLDHRIILPDNADSEFTSAVYEAGILCLHISKTNRPTKNLYSRIVVY